MQTLVYHGKMCLKYVINIDSNDCLSSHPVKGDNIYLTNRLKKYDHDKHTSKFQKSLHKMVEVAHTRYLVSTHFCRKMTIKFILRKKVRKYRSSDHDQNICKVSKESA